MYEYTENKKVKGITPAHAGKSALRQRLPVAVEDHPRACGEKGSLVFSWFAPLGSPPRMRGKVNGMPEV